MLNLRSNYDIPDSPQYISNQQQFSFSVQKYIKVLIKCMINADLSNTI